LEAVNVILEHSATDLTGLNLLVLGIQEPITDRFKSVSGGWFGQLAVNHDSMGIAVASFEGIEFLIVSPESRIECSLQVIDRNDLTLDHSTPSAEVNGCFANSPTQVAMSVAKQRVVFRQFLTDGAA